MSGLLLGAVAAEAQYICTAALILLCSLAGAHLYLMRAKKLRKTDEEYSAPPESDCKDESKNTVENKADIEPQTDALPFPGRKVIRGRYSKSFTAKLIQSPDAIKEYYAELANELLSFDKIRNRISWAASSFYAGRKAAAKFSIRGKTLYLYLALNPQEFQNAKFPVSDESSVKRYETVPLRVKVKSRRGVKHAKELIEILMRKRELTRIGTVCVKSMADYPYDTTKNLLARGLIKLKITDGQMLSDADSLIWADFERRSSVSAAEVQNLISDEVAATLIDEREDSVPTRPKGIINIDTLSQHYEANAAVTLESLKEKKLIGNSVNYVKVLARGVLDKPLTVKLPEFSVDAVKMIILTGGTVIKLKTTKADKL